MMKSSKKITSELASLATNDHEPIHFINQIQPHGLLLVLEKSELKIVHVSQNTQNYLGVSPELLLGQPLSHIFTEVTVNVITALLASGLEINNTFPAELASQQYFTESQTQQIRFITTVHRADQLVILELEPIPSLQEFQPDEFYERLRLALVKLKRASTLSELYQNVVEEIRKLIGFNRVMIYRFNPDLSGIVVAEDLASGLESYIGLHYPSVDIPASARDIFTHNWLRMIPDVNYQSVQILSDVNATLPLDLTASTLRGVSPCHLEYLRNMGVSASISISLINENRLWGLIACHHYTPKLVEYEMRKMCGLLGQLMSVELILKQEQELQKHRQQIKSIEKEFRQDLANHPSRIAAVFKRNKDNFLELVQAHGAALCLDKQIILVGQTPAEDQVQSLVNWLLTEKKQEVFYTDSLVEQYPESKNFQGKAGGILAISIVLEHISYHIIWFRLEQIYTVNWGGNPNDAVSVTPDGIVRLSPRGSFKLWKELVREHSLPWEPLEIEAAQELRHSLLITALQFSQLAWQEAAAQAQKANQAKSEFLANMSHEIRTPINAILGFTQLLEAASLSNEHQEYIQCITQGGESLLAIINDILDLSKLEAGELKLSSSQFDIQDFIQNLINLFKPQAATKGISLTASIASDVPLQLVGPVNRLQQVLTNLIGNAIKFTASGEVAIAIKVVEKSEEESTVKLYFQVQDTGIGLALQDRARIFEPFTQIDTSSTRQYEGTGLGLTICRKIVSLMGGEIGVESTLGEGSNFWFTSTLALSTSPITTPVIPAFSSVKFSKASTVRILVVEDTKLNRMLIMKVLENLGYQAEAIYNGQQALDLLAKQSYDIVLMDCQMPVLDGYEATRQLRQREKLEHRRRTIVIGVTAYAMTGDREKCLEAGMDDYLSKPIKLKDLSVLLEKWSQLT